MSKKFRMSFIALRLLLAAALFSSASAQKTNKSGPDNTPTPATPKTVVTTAPDASQTVRTASGIVRGVTEGDVSSFKEIPYAAAPVVANRWRPPQPALRLSHGLRIKRGLIC